MSNKFILMVVLAITATITSTLLTTTTQSVDAQREKGEGIADRNVHEGTGSEPPENPSDQDIRFHEGICQGGSSSSVCDLDIIGEPGGREALNGR
jgi:hypothetical protein